MTKSSRISLVSAFLGAVLLVLFLTTPQESSAEYRYTIEVLFKYLFYIFVLVALVFNKSVRLFFKAVHTSKALWLATGLLGLILFLIPLFSPLAREMPWFLACCLSFCWAFGAFCLTIFLFSTAVRLNNVFSSVLCLLGTLMLIFACGESYLLMTTQFMDGFIWDGEHSKYVLANQAQSRMENRLGRGGIFPIQPRHPSASVAHRDLKYGQVLYDVRYTLDKNGHRILPPAAAMPKAALLIFGCSFTFGYGLENDQTWPWLLAKDLGPQWKLENYAISGFGAQQMLSQLEDGEIEKPVTPFRQALFLAIKGHLTRFSGLFQFNSARYYLRDGELVRDGLTYDSPYSLVSRMPTGINGSQLARELSIKIINLIQQKKLDELESTYLAIIEKSSQLLKKEFDTTLTVLLWPNIDYLAPELKKRGIPILLARDMLPDWDKDDGESYNLVNPWDQHPSATAAREIADGLCKYYKRLWDEYNLNHNENKNSH